MPQIRTTQEIMMDQEARFELDEKLQKLNLQELRNLADDLEPGVTKDQRVLLARSQADLAQKIGDAVSSEVHSLERVEALLAANKNPVTRTEIPKEAEAAGEEAGAHDGAANNPETQGAPGDAQDGAADEPVQAPAPEYAPERIVQIRCHTLGYSYGDVIVDPVQHLSGMMYAIISRDQARRLIAEGSVLRRDLSRNGEFTP